MTRRAALAKPKHMSPWLELELTVRNALRDPHASRAAVEASARFCGYAYAEGEKRTYARLLNALRELAIAWRDVPPEVMATFEAGLAGLIETIDAWPQATRATGNDMRVAKAAAERRRDVARDAIKRTVPYWIND